MMMMKANMMTWTRPAVIARALLAALPLGLVLVFVVSPAHAALTFQHVGFGFSQSPLLDADGAPLLNMDNTYVKAPFVRQAGSHPDLTVSLKLPVGSNGQPLEAVKDVDVDLPKGFVGNPTAVATCSSTDLINSGQSGANCPVASQIGIAEIHLVDAGGLDQAVQVGLFNLAHGSDVPARFGFNYESAVGLITARVRPGDYGISSGSFAISQSMSVAGVRLTLWGVPSDPSHDSLRQDHVLALAGPEGGPSSYYLCGTDASYASSPRCGQPTSICLISQCGPISTDAARLPFLTAPTSCSADPLSFTMRGDSWEHPGEYDTRTLTTDEDGTPLTIEGCDRLGFNPSIDVNNLAHAADAPTGLDVDLKVPQPQDPDGLATAHVRSVKMVLPEGMSVSPSSAAGLGACSPAQIGLGTNDAPSCPQSSKLGSVTIDTPLLKDPLVGDMILATQNDNPFHTLVALYIAAKGPGFYLKLPGKIVLDPVTGRLTASFENTPQLPFSEMRVHFLGGSQAALATPTKCGDYSTHVELMSWSSDTPVQLESPMTIDQNCGAKAFAPSFSAGATNPLAGEFSPFSFTLTRSDGMPFLQNVAMALPPGMLADIASVPQCDQASANAGTCPVASRIGTTSVLSGPGAQPLGLTGSVSLTGPYKDAPFGLSIAVPTAGQAGPFDLGTVVVRAGIYVDRKANVSVKSDPLPTIIQGIPLRLRQVNVTIDRDKFMFNPTSCAQSALGGAFGALSGESNRQLVAFRVGGCGDLDLRQKLAMRLTGKKATKDGQHPGVTATLTDTGGANLKKVEVKLPLSLALDPDNAQALCKPEQRVALSCPKASIVGTATAKSVLPHALTGPVYFVEGLRKTASGRTVKTLPKLWIPLSADGVTIDIDASSAVDASQRLVTTFDQIPDAPIKSFNLKINGGKHGILVVSGHPGTCERDKTIDTRFTGQNAQVKVTAIAAKVDGCKPTVTKSKATKKTLSVTVANLDAGKLSLSARGWIASTSKTLKNASSATVTARLTRKAQRTIRRHGKATISVRIAYRPKAGKPLTVTKRITVHRH
jgi:hypothetical protein